MKYDLRVSYPRRRVSINITIKWIPAFAGMTTTKGIINYAQNVLL